MPEQVFRMSHDPLDAVYSYVERAYVRLQAGDLLIRCLEESSIEPLHQMVEGLVLAGPASIAAMREILAETTRRKAQVQDDLQHVMKGLDSSLRSYGVRLAGHMSGFSLTSLTPVALMAILRQQDIHDNATQVACLQILKESRDLFDTMAGQLSLLEDVERYLNDWLWGMAFQSTHDDIQVY
jgi:hypothetical protein